MKNYSQAPFRFKKQKRTYVLELIADLYEVPRTGWVDRGVKNPETVGEHIDAVIALAEKYYPFMFGLIPILKVHDWPERNKQLGDARTDAGCPADHCWTKEKKYEVELATMQEYCSQLGPAGKKILMLWLEYAEAKTERAKIAKQLDKLQRVLKAISYQRQGEPVVAEEFIIGDSPHIHDPVLIKVLEKAKLRLV